MTSPRRIAETISARIGPVARHAGAVLRHAAHRALDRYMDGGYQPDAAGADPADDSGIELRDVSLAYGAHVALTGLSGSFAPGSLTAVVGPNGAGKSSLLDLLAGTQRPNSGEVRCPARARRRLAFLPQQAEIDRDYPVTVGEVVALGLWRSFGALRTPAADAAQRVAAAVAAVGLEGLTARRIGELSVGQMQRVLFARLMLQEASVILLDEPFAAVDERTTADLLALVARWHGERRTVIAVMHDLAQVRAHFPAALLLARAPIAWGPTASVLTEANLARARETVQVQP